jgi:hypothetical protein
MTVRRRMCLVHQRAQSGSADPSRQASETSQPAAVQSYALRAPSRALGRNTTDDSERIERAKTGDSDTVHAVATSARPEHSHRTTPQTSPVRIPIGTYALAVLDTQIAGSGAGCAAAPSVVLCGRDECEPAVVASFRRFLLLVLILCSPFVPYRKRAGLSGTSRDRLRQGRTVRYDRPRAGPGRSIAAGLWGAIRGRL